MASEHKGLLVVWTDIAAELEYDFNEWYNRDHMRERVLGIDGFIRGRRFVSFVGGPKYLAVYELDAIAIVNSEPFQALTRDPDPVSRRFIPAMQNTMKGMCNLIAEQGEAEGGFVGVIPFERVAGRESEVRDWVTGELSGELMRKHGVVAVRYGETDAAVLAKATAKHMRQTDKYIDAMLLIEAASVEDLRAALALVGSESFAAHGGHYEGDVRQLRVIYTLHVPCK